jgi:hypothetical protein
MADEGGGSNDGQKSFRVKHRFTQREDLTILKMVQALGPHQWGQISQKLKTRTARQCRERWRHYLCPVIDRNPWTDEENALLAQEYGKSGPKWSQISPLFPGRMEVNLKNRWIRLHRAEIKQTRLDAKRRSRELLEMQSVKLDLQQTIELNGDAQSPQCTFPRMAVQSSESRFLPSILTLLRQDDRLWPELSFPDSQLPFS